MNEWQNEDEKTRNFACQNILGLGEPAKKYILS